MHGTPRPRSRWPRWLAAPVWAGVPLLGLGCSVTSQTMPYPGTPGVEENRTVPAAAREIVPVSHEQPQVAAPRELPISLDAVLRLAEQHNPRIGLAREKLTESQLHEANTQVWLPSVYAGLGYFRHEGGIQNPNGEFVHSSWGQLWPGFNLQTELDLREATFKQLDAERKVRQQQVELTQINNEILLEAALTYVDLLTAKRGVILMGEIERLERSLLERVEKLAEDEVGATALVEGLKSTVGNRGHATAKMKQQVNAASAKLVYLLGLPPGTCLTPIDALSPIELVQLCPACEMVDRAMTHGPGVHELEGILALIQDGIEKSYGVHNMLPTLQVTAYEGAFGAGVGGSLTWDNRLDVGVQLRWNLTELMQADQKRSIARSRQQQVQLTIQELRNKLAAGVQESRDAVLFCREQLGLAMGQIKNSHEHYRLTDKRVEEGAAGASLSDVAISIRGIEQAHSNWLLSLSTHNKAQVKLLLLMGPGATPPQAKPISPGVRLIAPAPGLQGNGPAQTLPAQPAQTLPRPKELPLDEKKDDGLGLPEPRKMDPALGRLYGGQR